MLPYFIKNSWYEISVVFYGKLEGVRPGAHVVMTLSGGRNESPQDVRVIFVINNYAIAFPGTIRPTDVMKTRPSFPE